MIPTTEELFKEYSVLCQFEEGPNEYLVDKECFQEALINFAKLHVEAALKAASEKAELDYGNGSCRECGSNKIDEYSILTAYLLSNIQ
jgi:hypothetical protein